MDTVTIIICAVLLLVVIFLIYAIFKNNKTSEKYNKGGKFKTKPEKKEVEIVDEPPRLKDRDEDKEPVIERVKLADNMRPKPEPLQFNVNNNSPSNNRASTEDKYFQSTQNSNSTNKAVIGKASNSDVDNIRRYLDIQGVPTKSPSRQRPNPSSMQFGTDEKTLKTSNNDLLVDNAQHKTVAEEFKSLSPQMKALILGDVLKPRGDTTWDDWNDNIDKKF